MSIAVIIVSAALAVFFIYGIIYTARQPKIPPKGQLRLPKVQSYIGGVCGLLFLIPTVLCALSEKQDEVYLSLGFLFFVLLAAVIVVLYINQRIEYDELAFTVKDFFGRTRRYDYSEITSLDVNVNDVTVRVGRKKISVDLMSEGFEDFLRNANRGYRHHHRKGIPPRDKEKDIFRGNIRGSDELLLGYIIGTVVIFAISVFLCFMPFVEDDETTTDLRETTFISYRYEENDIRFTAADGFEYELRNYDDSTDIASIIELCDSGESISVYCNKVNPKSGEDYYSINAIKLGDRTVLSFEETNRLRRNNNMFAIPFAIGFVIFWILTLVMTVIVGRNPQKYKKLVPLFFKGEYVK